MTTATVNIDSLDKIQAFVKIINNYNGRFDLVSGCSRVNAKSIMGIFSLDLSKPIDLNIHADGNVDDILAALDAYIIK